jgi:hypothetical protein
VRERSGDRDALTGTLSGMSGRFPIERLSSGTPYYVAPEQQARLPADARSDQYSFAVSLWEALLGEHPYFDGDGKRRSKPSSVPVTSRLPPAVWSALERGAQERPEERWPSMEALLTNLRERPRGGRRRWLVVGAVASCLVGAGVASAFIDTTPSDPSVMPAALQEGLARSQERFEAERFVEAAEICEQVYYDAEAGGHDELAVEAAVCVVACAAEGAVPRVRAKLWGQLAEAKLRRAGSEAAWRTYHCGMSNVAQQAGDVELAREHAATCAAEADT